MRPGRSLASFDSASGMLRALAHCLHGRDFALLGSAPRSLVPVLSLVGSGLNRLPYGARRSLYSIGSGREGLDPRKVSEVRDEEVASWLASHYPARRYPAVMVGSSSGAAVNLCAALGIPWLPQTYLVPVSWSGVSPDDPRLGLEVMREHGRRLLAANPNLQLHHMQDPLQDRLTLQLMTYFRVKRRGLGEAYPGFIRGRLQSGGTILLLECGASWPVTQVDERYFYQFGAIGDLEPREYFEDGARVLRYLREQGTRPRWDPPEPTTEAPEAEWGFEPAIREDVERLSREHGYRVCRIVFEQPEDLSPLVADLYRWWYRGRGLPQDRLLVESFIGLAPRFALRAGLVPYWALFDRMPSAERLLSYLRDRPAFDRAYVMLFSNGVPGVGGDHLRAWREVISRGGGGGFVGLDERAYPADLASFATQFRDLQKIPGRFRMPPPLSLDELEGFLGEHEGRYAVRLIWGP